MSVSSSSDSVGGAFPGPAVRALVGETFEIREALRELGCSWDGDARAWMAPAGVFARAQEMVDRHTAEKERERERGIWTRWVDYLGGLAWCDGEFTSTVWAAAQRAGLTGVAYLDAMAEIRGRVVSSKKVSDRWFERNVGRGYAAGEACARENAAAEGKGGAAGSSSFSCSSSSSSGGAGTHEDENEGRRTRTNATQAVRFDAGVLGRVSAGLAEEMELGWWVDRSPVDPVAVDAGGFLESLFLEGERVIVFDEFKSQGQWVWSHGEGFRGSRVLPAALYDRSGKPWEDVGRVFDGRGREGIWYLCAPVSGEFEWMEESRSDPHWSRRFEGCVVSWRYMVFESDKARGRDWLGFVAQLAMRVVAVYTSGSRSIHVLVRMDARNKVQWDSWRDEVKPLLVPLGADPGCFSGVRLTRLPGCLRLGSEKKGVYEEYRVPHRQRLLYLDPGASMVPIVEMGRARDSVGTWERVGESLLAQDQSEREVETVAGFRRAVGFFAGVERVQRIGRELFSTSNVQRSTSNIAPSGRESDGGAVSLRSAQGLHAGEGVGQ